MENKVCESCPYESIIEEIRRDIERNSSQHREFYSKFSNIETAQAVSDEKYNNLLLLMTEVKNSVNELKEKPVKRYENVTVSVLVTAISIILGYLACKVGLK